MGTRYAAGRRCQRATVDGMTFEAIERSRDARCATPTTCPTAGSRPRSSSRSRSRSRCCSRARPASARPRPPRRSPARRGARLIRLQCYEGLDVAHAVYEWNYPRQLLHIRAAQEGTVSEEELFGPEFLIRRPLLEAIESRRARRAADRRDRPRRRGVRGVPARGALRLPDHDPRARDDPRRAASRRVDPHLEPHARAARRAQAPLPLPLDRAPVDRARDRDRASCASRASPSGSPAQAARVRARAARRSTWPSRPGVAETIDWAHGARRARPAGARRRGRRADARLGAEVPRGHRGRARRRRSRGSSRTPRDAAGSAVADAVVRHVVTFGRVLREVGLEVGPGPRRRRAARPRRGRPDAPGRRLLDARGRRSSRGTTSSTLFDRAFAAWFLRAPVAAAPCATTAAARRAAKLGESALGRPPAATQDDGDGRAARARSARATSCCATRTSPR